MRSYTTLLALGALFGAVSAVPVKRDGDSVVTTIATTDVYVTTTVWVDYPTDGPTSSTETSATISSAAPPPPPVATQEPAAPPSATTAAPTTAPAAPVAPVAPLPSPSTQQEQAPPAQTTSSAPAPPPPPPPAPASAAPAPQSPPAPAAPAPAPSSATSAAVAPASVPSSGSSSGGASGGSYQHTNGDLTHYDPDNAFGSCGLPLNRNDRVVAVSAAIMDKTTMCGKEVTIEFQGNTTTATVQDTCGGCAANDLDLTDGLFYAVFPGIDGRGSGAKWSFI